MKKEKPKKKVSKKVIFFVLLFWVVIIISAGMSSEQEKLQKENKNSSAQSTAPVASAVSSVSSSSAAESTEPDTSANEAAPVDVPEETPGKAYAAVQSADTSVLDDMDIKVHNVSDDVTGNARRTFVTTTKSAEEYAIAYYKEYFESDKEIHFLLNFYSNTMSIISNSGNFLDVRICEHVDGEEHSGKTIGRGQLYAEYYVNLETGEIKQLDFSSDD
jgi:cytoskeletal protein RodZ